MAIFKNLWEKKPKYPLDFNIEHKNIGKVLQKEQ